ncbi:flagellar motor protein MotB [Liquorilactobacillus satsumensis]|uniref:Chemotaxis MotB protein n=2 Tax=Liquorilactobacillus satsumensis TaxID=259059 RepID=A0A0R1V7W5_9LACO|nr:flagellar motor protein MotB [Liquorilactobacillus satsumensis]AJA34323.1 chemotaxis protein MotB [Liquorilactobacillus satsumensis]KRL99170.1 chemotaxis MotB protein [Liquorilactobacillus satsumensis DSM 16230 = JCM 12392]MCC7666585.1 chemotaxis protein MotB [Liquorilactobacillus satsumensis]MCP9312884.1 OmpA family protein [Liquorilactobacillus satsumensis]MCP9329293.1 OmpA family protein [Liquorilactobacillus satsumensis]
MAKRKRTEDHTDEGWLLPYSDMLTLLLALFIVLFAMSKVNDKKFQEFKSEFGTILSVRSSAGGKTVISTQQATAQSTIKPQSLTSAQQSAKEAQAQQKLENERLQQVKSQLQSNLKAAGLSNNVNIALQSDGLLITMDSSILFDSGSAALSSQVESNLNSLSDPLRAVTGTPVTIAGYTDNVPIRKNSTYNSNWELSSARAIAVMNYFVANNVFRQQDVAIQAYAENHPKDNNSTAAGRAKNRRVEILIQRIATTSEK